MRVFQLARLAMGLCGVVIAGQAAAQGLPPGTMPPAYGAAWTAKRLAAKAAAPDHKSGQPGIAHQHEQRRHSLD